MGKGKKSKSGGPGPEVGECEAAVKAANEGHELVPVGEETLDAMEDRHRRERAAVEALCASLGQSKPEKDKRVRMMGWISQRQYEETRAWQDANEDADEGGDASSDDDADADAADALAKEVAAKAAVADADEPGAAGQGGMTKAMKRRLKKEAEERERDARIEEEKANAGPSEREDEEKILRALLAPRGRAIAEIKADGHCMYRSVEHQLQVRGDGGVGVPTDHVSLRRITADRLRADEWEYRPFAEEFAEETPAANEGWAKYCDDVEKTAAWGGQLELGALAKALRRSIVVFSARMPAVTMGEEFASEGGTPLLVCYQRHAFGLGEHYNSIVDV